MKYPDLSSAKQIAFDIETYDPNLNKMGPGVFRKDGKILGVSISDGVFKEYYNLGHYDCSAKERACNLDYLRKVLGNSAIKIGHRLMYDIDWLENGEHAIKVNGPLHSTDIAEALIDESQGAYSLEFIARKYLGIGKTSSRPEQFCKENGFKGDFRTWLWKMPHSLVREYAMDDSDLPLKIDAIQESIIEKEQMTGLYDMECRLTRCLLHLRKTGVRIDVDKRDANSLKVQNMIETWQQELFAKFGEFNVNSSTQVAKLLDSMSIPYPVTDKGNPQIDMAFYKLNRDKHPLLKKVQLLKQAKHELGTFLQGSFVRFLTDDGLIHCNFYNTRTDEYGTRSGRLSSANPNLQQISSKDKFRDAIWGQICREVFIPFENCFWGKTDYSQIEYRVIAHYAIGPGSEELRRAYIENPRIDYHKYVMDLTALPRGQAKALNFGIPYGMGINKMCEQFGWSRAEACAIRAVYDERTPYLKASIDQVSLVARRRGYIRTILNRRSRLTEQRLAYIMYCRLIQGSAADIMKKALLDLYESGIFNILHPHLTLHDEIDVSVPKTRQGLDAFREMGEQMKNAIKLKVPIEVDSEAADNWADVKKFDWNTLYKEVIKPERSEANK